MAAEPADTGGDVLTPPEPSRVTIDDLIYAVGKNGEQGVEILQTLLELLKTVARTDSMEEKSKSARETATYAELWLDSALGAVRKARVI